MTGWYTANAVLIQATMTTLLLALSIQLPLRMGVFSFAGVGCFGIGGYTAAISFTRFDLGTWPSVALGSVVAAVLCYLLGLLIHKLTGLYLGMATVAFTLIVAVVATNGGRLTGGASGIFGALGGITNVHLVVLLAVIVAGLTLCEIGPMGRRVDTVREDPELAAALGIDVARYRQVTFLASGFIGGLAGAVTTLLRSTITPAEVNFHLVVMALTVIIIGGAGSWLGAAIGAVIITWMPTVLSFISEWEAVIYGFVVALAAIVLPGGVLGLIKSLLRRLQRRRRPQPRPDRAEAAPDPEPVLPETAPSPVTTQGGAL